METNDILKAGTSADEKVLFVKPFQAQPFENPEFLNHTHNGIDSPQIQFSSIAGSGSGGGDIIGTLTTTDATPKSFAIITLPNHKAAYISARVIGENKADDEYGAFVRNAGFQNVNGITVMDQVQDAFTMRDDTWKVDYKVSGSAISLRVWGKAGKVILWTFKINVVS